MNTDKERTEQLNRDLAANKTICSSAGTISSFPEMMKDTFKVNGIGLILCSRGGFGFTLNQRELTAHAGDTVFSRGQGAAMGALERQEDKVVHRQALAPSLCFRCRCFSQARAQAISA